MYGIAVKYDECYNAAHKLELIAIKIDELRIILSVE
jgi:hypothetical protein